MGLVLVIAAVILGIGHFMGAPWRQRIALLGVLALAVLLIQLTLPDGHGLRRATGDRLANWAIFAGVVALVGTYTLVLRRLRDRARARAPETAQSGPFSAVELDRYARHIVLHEVGGAGQQKLKKARVCVVGAGGLGSPALLYLAAAGVGTIGVVDDDMVSLSNLQRQVLHDDASIGLPKVFSAQKRLNAINPHVEIRPYERRLDGKMAQDLFAEYDLILDGSDNFRTRYQVNAACVALGKPLISAAISAWEGQISLYHPTEGGPCYACVFPNEPDPDSAPTCSEIGVVGALPGVVGAMMAVEAIKWITRSGAPLLGQMVVYDALYAENRKFRMERRTSCPVCGDAAASA